MSYPTKTDGEHKAMRDVFIAQVSNMVERDPRLALVLADISAGEGRFAQVVREHPDRIINVGIREQLMIGVAGGLGLTGLRPIAHSYAPFLIERAFEQIKLDLEHQGTSAVLASVGASHDWAEGGYSHFSPRDVSLLDSIGQWRVYTPGHPDEVPAALTSAVDCDSNAYLRLSLRENTEPHHTVAGKLSVLKRGAEATVVAVGTTLDNVLTATSDMDVTVAYTNTPRPFDTQTLRELGSDTVVLVEPYHAGSSDWIVNTALRDRPHRLLSLGVGRNDLNRYGTATDHDWWHGLDASGIAASIKRFLAH